jgi:hypothetical protein
MRLISKIIQCVTVSLSFILIGGCNGSVPARNEIVMSEGQKVTATNQYGTITITAGKGLKRYYTWDGETRDVIMWPREDRWLGSMGIYYPGPGYHWKSNHGIARGCLNEGQMHFDTQEEALAWLKEPYNQYSTYTSDGLVVCFSKTPGRKQLNVDLWQIYIGGKILSKYQCTQISRTWAPFPDKLPDILKELNKKPVYVGGHKPQNLPGSQDDKIIVEYPGPVHN